MKALLKRLRDAGCEVIDRRIPEGRIIRLKNTGTYNILGLFPEGLPLSRIKSELEHFIFLCEDVLSQKQKKV